jgi:hypothetical protein
MKKQVRKMLAEGYWNEPEPKAREGQ